MSAKFTTEQFIEKARAVHGDRYDYSQVQYEKSSSKVTIVCHEHGPFEQTPNKHLIGRGCLECGGSKPLTTAEFIAKATAMHGDFYDYSRVEYVNNSRPVTITCPDHGPFKQRPDNHLSMKGCSECSKAKQHTTEVFIEKAKEVHGDRYDYSQVEYVNHKSPVVVICPKHGPFKQKPANHLGRRSGCPDCASATRARKRRHTTDVFVEKANAIHGNRYDYSQVAYENSQTKITIICPDHGPFQQTPNSHLSKRAGCHDCARDRPQRAQLSTEIFIKRAKDVHGDRYDYSKVDYVNYGTKVKIICLEHGVFDQTPRGHLSGKGCFDCAGTKKLNTEVFAERANGVHGDRYDYSLVNYVSNHSTVKIVCPKHGIFEQTPAMHVSDKNGCPDCGGTKKLTTEVFIEKAKEVHGDRYDYSQVEYVNNSAPITILCTEHGPFSQSPGNHLSKKGCPDCAESGFNPNDRATLYYIAIETDDDDRRYKIGITNRAVEDRFRPPDLARIRIIKTWHYALGRAAAEREAEILRQNAGDRYYGPNILQSGNTELFTHDVLGLDRQYEEDG